MTRRQFLFSGLALGAVSYVDAMDLVASPGRRFDEHLAVLLSDIHVNGLDVYPDGKRKGEPILNRMRRYLVETVDDILAMDPLPRHVIVFGDLAFRTGRAVDYVRVKRELDRLEAAGVCLTLGMGNHDHRAAFFEAWPEYRERTLVKDAVVTVTELPGVDLILLDSLDDCGRPDTLNPSDGKLTKAEREWMTGALPNWKRPFILGAHHNLDGLPLKAPNFRGFIHGHNHRWVRDLCGWGDDSARPLLGLPCNGYYGDIGYATLRIESGRAEATLVQKAFCPHYELEPGETHPAWEARCADNRGEHCTFVL